MGASTFDPARAVQFDLPRGAVSARGEAERLLLVPSSALDDLVLTAPREAVESIGRAIGASIGKRAAARIGDGEGASVEEFVTQLAGEAAISGAGALSIERWGRALVVVVEESPLADALLVPMIAAAIEAASGRKAACIALGRDDRAARVLVAGERAAARVREWIESGVAWGEALARLHSGAA